MAGPTAVQLRKLAKLGYAMPDGSYYIRAGSVGASDLQNAIDAVGRGEPQSSHNAIRVHIMKRAKALGLSDKIPADWLPDGSMKHDGLDQLADEFLQHFGIVGMRWGHHLPGVEVLGGPGNGGPSPFIQRGDHTGDKPGDSGPSGQSGKPPAQQSQDAIDALKALRDRVTQDASSAKAQAEGTMPTDLTKEQAAQVHAATASHLAQVAQIHNKAVASASAHKAAQAKIATHPNKAQARRAKAASAKLHAAHMNHLAKTAHQAHAAHKAHVAKLKVKTKLSELTTQDKKELAKLSPVQRSALKKLTPQQRATLGHMTAAQRAKLSHLTQAEKTALSHLTSKQKAALAKATAASAKKRHEAAMAKKAAGKAIVSNKSTAAAKKVTAAVQAKRTPAQKAAIAKLALNARNHMQQSMDDPVGTFLEHFGVKGMKWGVRRNGGHPGRAQGSGEVHPISADAQKAHHVVQTIHKHGTAALSNEDLQHLVNRQRLLQQHAQLNPADPSTVRKGLDFVKTVTGDAKTVLDAVETGRRAVKTFNGLAGEKPPGRQSRRTRNAPLKVVDIRAA